VVAKEEWELPGITVELRVLSPSGRPRRGVDIYAAWNTNTCGGHDRIAETDAEGTARLELDATFGHLGLMIGGPYSQGDPDAKGKVRDLTDAELGELFLKRKLTIQWDQVVRQVPQMLARPLGYWTSAPVNCENVSGKWADPENGGTWTLNQIGDNITGSLTVLRGNCGSRTWQVTGRMNGGVVSLTVSKPEPSVDKCGVAAPASTTVTRAPYCNTGGRK
jgi:hypothetical protein